MLRRRRRRGRGLPARARRRRCARAASTRERIVARPGHRLRQDARRRTSSCCARQDELLALGVPLLVGWSRKSTLRRGVTGARAGRASALGARASPRRCWRSQRGARIVRVHDVAATVDALKVWQRRDGADNRGDLEATAQHAMSRTYFGTDGIRGTVGAAPITPDFVLRLGHAVGRVLQAPERARPTVLIGKDTRISGYMLESRARGRLRLGRRRRRAAPARCRRPASPT